MGTYVYTCRKPHMVVDGIRIGMFSFAYRYSSWDGWVPESFNSNRWVKAIETRAKKARLVNVATQYFIHADSLAKNKLYEAAGRGFHRIPVFQAYPHEYQHVEMFANDKPVGYLYFDVYQKIRFAPAETEKTSCTA
jgi:hypothetical protein